MPFDATNFEPTADPILERLILGRARIADATCWAKEAAGGVDGRYCAGLALIVGRAYDDPHVRGTWDALEAALPKSWKFRSVVGFNDHPDTTHADILALYDRAIAARKATARP